MAAKTCRFQNSAGGRNIALNRLRQRAWMLALAAGAALPAGMAAAGNPMGNPIQVSHVVAGAATFAQAGGTTTITAANNTIINYERFNIPHGNTVDFIQPSATARVLNRIIGPSPTQIDGNLNANGIVYFVNPAGVMFGQGAVVNVGQLYAAAGHFSDADFLAGGNVFTDSQGSLTNAGVIRAGDVTFAAQHIRNTGTIVAPRGMIVMAAGTNVYVSKLGSPFVVKVAGGDGKGAGVNNSGTLNAQNGDVAIRAGDMYSLAIDTSGSIHAGNVSIQAAGADSTVLVSGKIDAADQGADSTGGSIRINGGQIGVGVTADAAGAYHAATALLNASGADGGGKILIGVKPDAASATGYSDASQYDFVGSNVVLNASATIMGHGGLVDTSGQVLQINPGAAVLVGGAGGGTGGSWLLDPANLTITHSTTSGTITGTGTSPETFQAGTGVATGTVSDSDITTGLATGDNVLVETTNSGASGGSAGNITVNGTVNIDPVLTSNVTLTLQANNAIDLTSGAVILPTNSGANTFLLNVALIANHGSGGASPNIVMDGNITTLGGTFSASTGGSGSINLGASGTAINSGTGLQTYTGPVTLSSATTLLAGTTPTTGVTFSSTVDGGQALTIGSSTSATDATFGGNVGTATSLASLQVFGATSLAANVTTAGNQTYAGAVNLTGTVALASTGGTGNITLNSTVDGNDALTVEAATAIFSGNVGTGASLASLSVGGYSASGPTGAGAATLAGNVTTSGNQTYSGAVTLGAGIVLSGSGVDLAGGVTGATNNLTVIGAGTFATVSGVGALQETGNAIINGNISTTTSVDVSGTTALNAASITTSGAQTYSGNLTLGSAATLSGSTVDLGGVTGASHNLTVVGAGTFGTVAGVGALTDTGNATFDSPVATTASISVTGSTLINTASIGTTGTQSYSGGLTLGTATVLTGSAVSLSGGVTGGANNLTVTGTGTFGAVSGVGALVDNGNAVFNGIVSGTNSIDVTGSAAINIGSITTPGNQTFSGAVTLGNAVTLASTGGAGAITFGSSISGAFALTVESATTDFQGNVGSGTGLTALASLSAGGYSAGGPTSTGVTTLAGNVSTTGGQTYANSLTIGAGTFTLSDNSSAGISTHGITGTGSATLNMNEQGTGAVSVNGVVSSIGALNVTASGTVNLGGNISAGSLAISSSTTGTPIALLAPVTIDANAQSYSVSGAGVALNFPNLLLSGLHVADQAGTAAPTSLTLTQTGSITDSDLPALTAFPGSTVAGMNYTIDSLAGNISLGVLATAPVSGANLTLSAPAGSITIGTFGLPIIGALTATAVSTGAITLNNNVTTSGNQTYGGPVTLGNSIVLASTGATGVITFTSTISGAQSLVTEANSILFQGNVGSGSSLTPLTSLAAGGYSIVGPTAVGTITLGGNVTTAGNQAWDDAVNLAGNATLASSGSSGTITFGSTISGGDALAVEAASTVFDNNVGSGSLTPLTSLAVGGYSNTGPTASGTVQIGTSSSGGSFSTTGNQSFNAMTLHTNAVFTSTVAGSLTFASVTGTGTGFTATAGGSGNITASGLIDVSGGAGAAGFSGSGGSGGAGGNGGAVHISAGTGAISLANVTSNGGAGGAGGMGLSNFMTGGIGGTGGAGGAGGSGGTISILGGNDATAGNINDIGGTGGAGGAGGLAPFGTPGFPGSGGNGGAAASVTITSSTGVASAGNITAIGAVGGSGLASGASGANANIVINGANGFTLNAGTGNSVALSGAAISITGSGTLDGDTTLTGTTLNSGAAGFAVSAGNAHSLTLQLSGAVNLGSLGGLNTLMAANSGPFTLGGNISTLGSQTFDGPVNLAAPVILTSSNAGGILFSGSPATINGNQPLTVSTTGTGGALGTVTFGGIVGGAAPLASLTVTGNVSLGGNVTTIGSQTFNDGVTLNDGGLPVTFTFLAGSNTVSFNGTLDGQTAGDSAVVIGSGGQPSGAILGGNVGGTHILSSLTVNGGVSIGANVTTFGNQTYLGNAMLTGTSDSLLANFLAPALVKFGGTVDGASALSIGNSGTFLTSNAEFDGTVGGHTSLTSLLVTGAATLGGNVTTAGTQEFNGALTLAHSAALVSTGSGSTGNISFGSTVDGSGGLPALSINTAGTTNFGGVVGGPVPASADISGVDVQNGPAALAGNVSTTGGQTYAKGASIGASLTLTGTTLNASPAAAAAFTGTGTQDLTLNFSTSVNLDLVNSSMLGNLYLDNPTGALTIPQSVAINYPLTVAGPVTLGRNTDPAGTNLNLDGPSFSFQNTLSDGGNGNDNLVIGPMTGGSSGGNLQLQGAVGGTSATDFASLSVAGTTTLGNNATAITTVGSQVYRGAMSISNGNVTTTLSSSAGGIEEDGGISDLSGSIALQPTRALVAPTSILGGADKGDFRPQAYLTLNGSISAPVGTVSLAFLEPTYQGATTFTTGGGAVIGVVPDAATIVTTNPGGLSVLGQIVKMGPYQKWTSLGTLGLTANQVFLGDMNVAGTLSISSPSIAMWLRPAGSLLVAGTGGTGALGLHTDTAGQDGVDIVANSISMSSTPVGDSSYSTGLAPQFAIGSGGSSNVQPVHDFGVPISASLLSASNTTSSTPATYYLDLRATGPATSNVFFTVSPIIPPPAPQINTIVVLSESERTILREAGINARNTPLDDMLDLYGGRAVFNDIPTSDGVVIIHPTLLDYYVTTSRLPYQQTKDFITLYRSIFLQSKIDPKTHRPVLDKAGNPVYQSRRTALHLLFKNSYAAYVKAVGPTHATALGYRTWLARTPAQAAALNTLKQLHQLLIQAHRLGLTAVELRLSTSTILAQLNPEALSERQFEEAVTATRLSHL